MCYEECKHRLAEDINDMISIRKMELYSSKLVVRFHPSDRVDTQQEKQIHAWLSSIMRVQPDLSLAAIVVNSLRTSEYVSCNKLLEAKVNRLQSSKKKERTIKIS